MVIVMMAAVGAGPLAEQAGGAVATVSPDATGPTSTVAEPLSTLAVPRRLRKVAEKFRNPLVARLCVVLCELKI
jgi:hypothetical protein